MTTPTKHEVECPHPACYATLRVPDNAPAGEYQCKCHSCMVRLSWAAYLGGENKPYLTLVEKDKP